jgi:hypothetical protein
VVLGGGALPYERGTPGLDIWVRVEVLGVWRLLLGSGFRVLVWGFRMQDSGYRVQGLGCRVKGVGCGV